MRKRIYIAGPISRGDILENHNQAVAAQAALMKAGFAPFNPMLSMFAKAAFIEPPRCFCPAPCDCPRRVLCEATRMGDRGFVHADWMGCDEPWVLVAHAVLRLPGDSTGADMEVAWAEEAGIPVFYSVESLHKAMGA